MEKAIAVKNWICAAVAALGGWISYLMGGWSVNLWVLLGFIALDYGTGLIVAGVFKASIKSKGGGLDSRVGWKGIWRKIGILIGVVVCHLIDLIVGTTYIRDAVVLFFCCNDAISILENLGLMGVPLPEFLLKMLDQVKEQANGGKTPKIDKGGN